jgi:hypothetical protein
LDFAALGVVRFAAALRVGLALALPRFELFLRVATRFFALAMAVSCEVCRRQANLGASHYLSAIRHATFIPHPRMMPRAGEESASYPAHSRLQQWAVKAIRNEGLPDNRR